MEYIILCAYVAAAAALLLFGSNCYVVLFLFMRRAAAARAEDRRIYAEFWGQDTPQLPRITTQLPLYNEQNVARRIIDTVCALDYPRQLHQIQVVDDSSDSTCAIVDERVGYWRQQGVDIEVVRREDRTGFKAGGLENATRSATGEFIAIFDADFVPESDFLKRTIPFFICDEKVALVQGRWGHLNADRSLLTRIQAIGIDGHFLMEQSARAWNGLFMNFNGTGGLLRRSAIIDAGGWEHDTLTEDMDLSYRMQLRGWKMHYAIDTVVPAELPENIHAFKSQQFRWAKGSIQTCKKHFGRVMRSDRSPFAKFQAFMHMAHYGVHPLMLILALFALPVLKIIDGAHFPLAPTLLIGIALLISLTGPSALYVKSQLVGYRRGWQKLLFLPFLVAIGVGLAVSNSRAVFEALIGKVSAFIRTPKQGERCAVSYANIISKTMFFEVLIGIYCLFSFAHYIRHGNYFVGPFLGIYAMGFLFIGIISMAHSLPQGNRSERYYLAVAVTFALGALCYAIASLGTIGPHFPLFMLLYALLWLLALLFYLSLPRNLSYPTLVGWIFLAGVLCRLALMGLAPTDDMNRYLWEGKVLASGISPYAHAPDDPLLQDMRGPYYAGINHKDVVAIYPPLSIALFALLGKIAYAPFIFKSLFVLFDLMTLVVIFGLLHYKKRSLRWSILYALNPIILLSFAGQAHFDSIMIFFMMLALLLVERKAWSWAFVALGIAIQIKIVALLALPFLITRDNLRYAWAIVPVVLAPYLPFVLKEGGNPLGSLMQFGTEMAHNGSVHALLRGLTGSMGFATALCIAALALFLLWLLWRRGSGLWAVGSATAAALLLSPTVHFWYLAWLTPFICFKPRWSWVVLALSSGCYFIADYYYLQRGVWMQPAWVYLLIWGPVYGLFYLEYRIGRSRQRRSAEYALPESYSIVIPALNCAEELACCLQSIEAQEIAPREVIVVDGGSSDTTAAVATRRGAQLLRASQRGRGNQIADGVSAASGDIIVIVHADVELRPDSCSRIVESFFKDRRIVGGALGTCFNGVGIQYTFVEMLNDLKASLFGISFGDQVQFMRRDLALKYELVPRYPLMEDVELACRLLQTGKTTYLWGLATVSDRKWQQGFVARFAAVISLLMRFFYRRLRGDGSTEDLYACYYAPQRMNL